MRPRGFGKGENSSNLGNWKPFKNDEKCFHFTLKALFVLKIFGLFHVKKRLD